MMSSCSRRLRKTSGGWPRDYARGRRFQGSRHNRPTIAWELPEESNSLDLTVLYKNTLDTV